MRFSPEVIGGALRAVRDRPERQTELQAYRHNNGFVKIKVAEAHGLCMRLHIWPAGKNRRRGSGSAQPSLGVRLVDRSR